MKKTVYQFEANGRKETIVTELGPIAAMAEANARFRGLAQGAWVESGAGFRWATGNFFD